MSLVGNTQLVAGGAATVPLVLELLKEEGIPVQGNPDVYIREYVRFGIDEARSLRERAALRAVGAQRVFIIVTPGMTSEAQNALLKTLEEPRADALFFFIVPAPQTLLATLRSRAQILTLDIPGMYTEAVDVEAFLAATPQKRLDMLKVLLEKDENDTRNLGAIIAFLASLERMLGQQVGKSSADGIHAVHRARKYIGDKGALMKPLLEQVALLVPMV